MKPDTSIERIEQNARLEVHKLAKAFDVHGCLRPVLKEISFSLDAGEFVCITGRSGCGKTTLLNILAGFLLPDSGTVKLNGKIVNRSGPERCMVFQEDALFPWLTVWENTAFGLQRLGFDKTTIHGRVTRLLDLVGLVSSENHLPREISGGMKQRVALARVLVLQPQILLMDEPFSSLDTETREEMQDLLTTLWAETGSTILFVTHDMDEAVLLADRILVMDRGSIAEEISLSAVRPRRLPFDLPQKGFY